MRPFIEQLPRTFRAEEGELMKKGRNIIRRLEFEGHSYVVKSYKKPALINAYIYGLCRSSKAQRSYENAQWLLSHGLGSPEPVAWMDIKQGGRLTESYFVSRMSECNASLFNLYEATLQNRNATTDDTALLQAIARTTAKMHHYGCIHLDYSCGNILYKMPQKEGEAIRLEFVDLNRMRFRHVGEKEGLRNAYDRLLLTDAQRDIVEKAYTAERQRLAQH